MLFLDRRNEFTINGNFCEEHFLVGLCLQQVACLLAGCADAGDASSSSSSGRIHRQPLALMRSRLAKLAFDPRDVVGGGTGARRQTQSRICMLYLPLVKIALENITALGPPGETSTWPNEHRVGFLASLFGVTTFRSKRFVFSSAEM